LKEITITHWEKNSKQGCLNTYALWKKCILKRRASSKTIETNVSKCALKRKEKCHKRKGNKKTKLLKK
jgi:hypothetical protein